MSIPGQQSINVGLPNESINSDSLYTAFTKTEQNFDTLFSCASPFTNFVGSTGIGVSSNANSGTVTITNTGVTNIVAGTNIVINQSNGNVTISATGGGNGGGGITSVGLLPGNISRLVVTNSPLVTAGNIGIDLATTGITEGTYTNPNVTVDPYGRVVGITNGPAVGTVTSVGLTAGPGVQVNGGPIQSSGNIIVTNTGVIRLTAGSGIDLSSSNGNVTVSLAGGGIGSVTSVGVYSTSLNISGSPITTAGNIRIELPTNPATAGTFTAGNLTSVGTLSVTGNANVGNIGATEGTFSGNVSAGNVTASTFTGLLTTSAQPNITSVGTLTSLVVGGNVSSGNANLGNTVTANFFSGSGQLLSAIQAANVVGTVANAANSLRVSTTLQSTGIYYLPFVSSVATANYGLNSNSSFVANIANGSLSATTFIGTLSGAATTAGTVTTAAQPNITSVGTLTALNISGNSNVTNLGASGLIVAVGNVSGGNLTTNGRLSVVGNSNVGNLGTGAIVATGNITFSGANISLGSNSNVRITGGTANALLQTDGNGNLSWTTPTTSYVHTQSSASTTWVVTHNLGVQFVNVQLVDSTGNSFTGRYNYPTITFNNTSALTVTFDSAQAGYVAVTSGGGAQGPQGNPGASSGGEISNGVSNVSILTSGGNVTVGVGGTANLATFTQTGVNVAGTANIIGNANVGNIGATNGVFTNVSGNGSGLSAIAGANVTGQVANALVAGTVYTAAQPNITSVGTLASLNVTGNITSNGTVGGATATHLGTALTTGANTTAGTITGNWSLSPGSRLQSTYADLAEYYEADDVYAWGNVLEFGGSKEVTIASNETTRVAGVVSKNPAYVMNSTCPGLLTAIALQGRVPCKVVGPVHKGDMMVSAGDGYAKASASPALGSVIGKALENFTGTEGVIEIVVGRL